MNLCSLNQYLVRICSRMQKAHLIFEDRQYMIYEPMRFESIELMYGNLVQIRHFTPCGDGACDWVEQDDGLQNGRWYSTNQILPDGSIIVVGGRGTTTVEYVPANGRGTFDLPLLTKVRVINSSSLPPPSHNCINKLSL